MKLRENAKAFFLGSLRERLRQQAMDELASGKLRSPAILGEICDRLIPSLRKNPATGMTLKFLGVSDEELRETFRCVLDEVGVELK